MNNKIDHNLSNPSLEFAYIAGISEDAHLGTGGKEGYEFDIESKYMELLEKSVAPRLTKLIKKPIEIKKRTTRDYYRIRFWNKDLVSSLNKIKKSPEIVLKWNNEQKLLWVSGFTDAEGSVTKTGENQPMLSIYSSDLKKLNIIEEILNPYGIQANYYKSPERNVWQQYYTSRKNLKKLFEIVQFEHPQKRKKLISLLRL